MNTDSNQDSGLKDCTSCYCKIDKRAVLCYHCNSIQEKKNKKYYTPHKIAIFMMWVAIAQALISGVQLVDTLIKHADVNTISKNLDILSGQYSTEVGILKQSNEINLLKNKAISVGVREAYDKLVVSMATEFSEKNKDGKYNLHHLEVKTAVYDIEHFYSTRGATIPAITDDDKTVINIKQPPTQIPTEKLMKLLDSESDWLKFISVTELGNRKEKGVLAGLVRIIFQDDNLNIVVQAMNSFNRLMEIRNSHNEFVIGYYYYINMEKLRHHATNEACDKLGQLEKYWKEHKSDLEIKMLNSTIQKNK